MKTEYVRAATAAGAAEEAATEQISYTVGSGNVFEDLGFAAPAEVQLKAELARQISEIIRERGLTQTAAAKQLGVDQPKISALLRGRLSGFTIDRLVKYAATLGYDAQVVLRPQAEVSSETAADARVAVTVPQSLRESSQGQPRKTA